MLRFGLRTQLNLYIVLVIVNALLATIPAFASDCDRTGTITFLENWRGTLGSDEQWLRLPYRAEAAPEIVVLEVTRPLSGMTGVGEPLLAVCSHGFFGNSGVTRKGGMEVLERSATRQVLLLWSPVDVIFRVASQDSLRPAGPVKVTASFVADVPLTKETEEIEIEPEDNLGEAVGDDHADTITGATPLEISGAVAGEIANAWGDDADVFSFDLAEERIVVVETRGTTDTIGGLLDASGRLLAVDGDGGPGGNLRLARALLPGRYFIRVEGSQGAEGPYTLTLETLSW